jgi:serine/threonine protein kinase
MMSEESQETLSLRLDRDGLRTADELKTGLLSLLLELERVHAAGQHVSGSRAGLLSPESILVDSVGRWSLAKSCLTSTPKNREVRSNQLAYLSPEQRDRGELSPLADIYAIGVITFEALVGSRPEGHEGLRERDSSLPLWAERVFKACYAPSSRRPRDAAALLELLNDALAAPKAIDGMIFGTAIDPQLDIERLHLEGASPAVKLAPSMREPDFAIPEPTPPAASTRSRMALLLSFLIAFTSSIALFAYKKLGCELHHHLPDPNCSLGDAKRAYESGLYAQAYSHCQRFLDISNDPEGFHLRGLILAELGSMNDALDDLNRALIASPERAQWYRDRADVLVYLRDPGKAIADYQRYLALSPEASDASLLRGRCAELAARKPL